MVSVKFERKKQNKKGNKPTPFTHFHSPQKGAAV